MRSRTCPHASRGRDTPHQQLVWAHTNGPVSFLILNAHLPLRQEAMLLTTCSWPSTLRVFPTRLTRTLKKTSRYYQQGYSRGPSKPHTRSKQTAASTCFFCSRCWDASIGFSMLNNFFRDARTCSRSS